MCKKWDIVEKIDDKIIDVLESGVSPRKKATEKCRKLRKRWGWRNIHKVPVSASKSAA